MSADTATIFVNKLGAAERQLNAAIRMYLSSEDPLAVHTVAAAAYRIIREIKEQRTGRSDSHELFLIGLFKVANDLESGKIKSMPEKLADPVMFNLVESIREGIRKGAIKGPEDISTLEKPGFWKKFNTPANFLKHADEDPDGVLDLSKLKNEELLMRSAGALVRVTNRPTPEMEALMDHFEKENAS